MGEDRIPRPIGARSTACTCLSAGRTKEALNSPSFYATLYLSEEDSGPHSEAEAFQYSDAEAFYEESARVPSS